MIAPGGKETQAPAARMKTPAMLLPAALIPIALDIGFASVFHGDFESRRGGA